MSLLAVQLARIKQRTPQLQKYLVLFTVRFGGVAMQTFTAWLAMKMAGPTAVGVYYLFVAYTLVLGWSLSFGLPEYVMIAASEGGASQGSHASLSRTALITSALIGGGLEALGLASIPIAHLLHLRLPDHYETLVVSVGIGVGALIANRTVAQMLKVKGQNNAGLTIEFVAPFVPMAIAIPLIAVFGEVSGAAMILLHVLGLLLSTLLGFLLIHQSNEKPSAQGTTWRIRGLLFGALPQWIAVSLQSLFLNLPLIIVPWFGTVGDVGIFGLAMRIAATALIGTDVVIALFGPRFARLNFEGAAQELRRAFEKSRLISILTAAPALVVGVLFADPLLGFFGIHNNPTAVMILRMLLIGRGLYAAVGPVSYFLWMVRRHKFEILATGVATVSILALSLLFGPAFGVVGVAGATVLGMIVRFGAQAFDVYRTPGGSR